MPHVFLSYDHEDHNQAELVSVQLEQKGLKVWQDTHDLRGGDLWAEEIDKAITESLAVIVLLTPDSENSPFVTYEWSFAMGKDKVVIPLLFSDKCKNIHPKLEPIQYLDFSNRFSRPWDKLTGQLHEEINRLEQNQADKNSASEENNSETTQKSVLADNTFVEPPLPTPAIHKSIIQVPASLDINGWHINAPIFPEVAKDDYGHDQYGYWFALTHKGLRQIFRWIPPGRIQLGSPKDEVGRYSDEALYPVHFQDGFWMGDFPVTQLQYHAITGENPSYFKQKDDKDLPVESVSWLDADRYLQQLNKQVPGLDARLPMECEWEYACRAGTTSAFWFGDSIDSSQVNVDGNLSKTNAYQVFPVNPWGLYDMHGNVYEWCLDPWQEAQASGIRSLHPHQESQAVYKQAIALLQEDESQRFSVRGGSWNNYGQYCRSANRNWDEVGNCDDDLGFRLVRSSEL